MLLQPHPEAGKTYRRARQSLFTLLVITLLLSLLLNLIADQLWAAHWTSWDWWVRMIALVLPVIGLAYAGFDVRISSSARRVPR